jgi:hypothetical protein
MVFCVKDSPGEPARKMLVLVSFSSGAKPEKQGENLVRERWKDMGDE